MDNTTKAAGALSSRSNKKQVTISEIENGYLVNTHNYPMLSFAFFTAEEAAAKVQGLLSAND